MKTEFTKKWILEIGIPIIESYEKGELTIRALHYQLVSHGMTNDINHYKKVVNAMIEARWDKSVDFDAFSDHDRESMGFTSYHETDVETAVDEAKREIKAWATGYSKNRWENQPYYPEIWIEKKALQGVFQNTCMDWDVSLNPCKGYPSLTFLHDAKIRFQRAENADKKPIILYFGDYDCSGEDIPRSIVENLERMGIEVKLKRIALMENQVVAWKLPHAPTKKGDTRGRNWEGLGQVELDAVAPKKIKSLLTDALEDVYDTDLASELKEQEAKERAEFKEILLRDFPTLLD